MSCACALSERFAARTWCRTLASRRQRQPGISGSTSILPLATWLRHQEQGVWLRGEFTPVFGLPTERVLLCLSQGFGDGEPSALKFWITCEIPSRLTKPALDMLSCVTQAIHQERPLKDTHHSLSSGETEREMVPFALIDNGLRGMSAPWIGTARTSGTLSSCACSTP